VRRLLVLSAIFFLLFFYGLVLSQTRIGVLPEELEPHNSAGYYDYRGITNVHTNRALGSGSPLGVVKAAQEAGLDFLFITDLNIFAGAPLPEGYHRKLLLMAGAEYSYLESRLLLYDIQRRHPIETLGQTQTMLADLLSQSGPDAKQDLIILAHPTKPGFTWNGAIPSGLDGIEVLNLKSMWREAWDRSKLSFLWSGFVYPFNSQLALIRLYDEPEEELNMWDRISASRPAIGIAGADATARTNALGIIVRFPSYSTSFSMASNHVLLNSELTGEAEGDRRKILNALTEGQFYMALDSLGNPKGFTTFIQDGDKTHAMGATVKWAPGMKISVHLPRRPKVPFEAAFIKDGQHIMSSNSVDTEYEIHGPGVYRVIIRVFLGFTLPDGNRWVTWIYTNPFYVK
jgi:hypothetical protein